MGQIVVSTTGREAPRIESAIIALGQEFFKQLRQIVRQQKSQNLVYIDECGFDNRIYQDYGYAKRGKKLDGSRTENRAARENLIAARRNRELLAPMLLPGSVNAIGFEQWLEQWLCKKLRPKSTLLHG